MPRAGGQRWLDEAESLLFETDEKKRLEVLLGLLRSVPEVAALKWQDERVRWRRSW